MNLAHVRHVISSHRRLVVAGVLLSLLAAIFVYGRPSWEGRPTMEARTPEVWRASSVLFLTEEGFPWGRAVPNFRPGDPESGAPAVATGDQSRFSSLAVLYAELATSDRVRTLAEASGKIKGDILAEPITYQNGSFSAPVILPMVKISVTASSATEALRDTQSVARALKNYVAAGQIEAKIRAQDRVLIQSARTGDQPGDEPLLVSGPSKAVPVVLFLLLLGLVLMTVFAYDNYQVHSSTSAVGGDRLRPVTPPAAATPEGPSDQPRRERKRSPRLRPTSTAPRASTEPIGPLDGPRDGRESLVKATSPRDRRAPSPGSVGEVPSEGQLHRK